MPPGRRWRAVGEALAAERKLRPMTTTRTALALALVVSALGSDSPAVARPALDPIPVKTDRYEIAVRPAAKAPATPPPNGRVTDPRWL